MMGPMTALIIALLATARITRLITRDRIALAPRAWALRRLIRRFGEDHLLPYLMVCDWCVGMYVGAGVTAAWVSVGDTLWFQAPAAALALSYAAGFLASKEGE